MSQMGHTPLHFAAREGHIEAVKMLLESNAYAHVENHVSLWTFTCLLTKRSREVRL